MSETRDEKSTTVAVVGATGQQGGATARALLRAGAQVRAVVRDPQKPGAQELARSGAEVVRGDLADPSTLRDALAGVDALSAMTTFTGPRGTAGEVQDGEALVAAAREAGVPRVVYSSVGGAERSTGIPHFESKRRVEEALLASGLDVAFVRPTFFMENFTSFFAPQEEDGVLVLRAPLAPGVPLQMVAVADIGAVAARVLLDPSALPDGAVEIAGDELSGEQIAAAMAVDAGRPARFEPLPVDVVEDEDQKAMFAWFQQVPSYEADRTLTRRLTPDVQDLRTWLSRRG